MIQNKFPKNSFFEDLDIETDNSEFPDYDDFEEADLNVGMLKNKMKGKLKRLYIAG